jgi:hypothetical protein
MNPKQLLPLAVLGACGVAWGQPALEPLWSIAPGTTLAPGVTLGGVNSNTERGLAYNPFTGHVLVVSRQDSPKIIVLDAATGGYVGTMDLTGVSGGFFPINMIDVAENGQIYAANLTTSLGPSNPFKVYQWTSEASAPRLVYSGDLGGAANTYRFGDSFRVRSSSAMIEVIAGAGGTSNVDNILAHLASFDDGDTFAPEDAKAIAISGIGNGDMRLGLSFGSGFWIYADQNNTLRRINYDPFAGTGSLAETYTLTSGAGTTGPNAFDPVNNLLATLTFRGSAGEQRVNLYDASQFVNGGTFDPIDFEPLPTQNANANGVGNLDFSPDGSLLFVVSPNNGIMAFQVIPEPAPLALLGLGGLALWCLRRR